MMMEKGTAAQVSQFMAIVDVYEELMLIRRKLSKHPKTPFSASPF
jgi:hypothetical protein